MQGKENARKSVLSVTAFSYLYKVTKEKKQNYLIAATEIPSVRCNNKLENTLARQMTCR